MSRAYGSRARSKKEAVVRTKRLKQRLEYDAINLPSSSHGDSDDFEAVGVQQPKKNRGYGRREAARTRTKRKLPLGALPIWKTADPTFGAPSPQHVFCVSALGITAVCLCIPELSVALKAPGRLWVVNFLSWGPQFILLLSVIFTCLSVCCSSKCCMACGVLTSALAIPAAIVQMTFVAIPAVVSFCCCFPDKCYGEANSVQSSIHVKIPKISGTHGLNGNFTNCEGTGNLLNNASCALQSSSLILFWSGISLVLVAASSLVSAQWHWRSEEVWRARARDKIFDSRQPDSDTETDSSPSDSDSGSSEDERRSLQKRRKDWRRSSNVELGFVEEETTGASLSEKGRKEELNRLFDLARKQRRETTKPPHPQKTRSGEVHSARVPTRIRSFPSVSSRPVRTQSARDWGSNNQTETNKNEVGAVQFLTPRVSANGQNPAIPYNSSANQFI